MPQFLSKIVGQDKVISILEKFFENQNIPHALLFSGNKGVGKYYTALQFSKEINFKIISNQIIKNKFNQLDEPYIKYVVPLPDTKTEKIFTENTQKLNKEETFLLTKYYEEINKKINNPYFYSALSPKSSIRINQIREIKKFLTLDFNEIPFRTVIIEEANLMTDEAQNALLKNLEEPPNGIVFILLVSNLEQVLPTIKSRCQIINFEPLSDESLNKIISKYYPNEAKSLMPLSQISNGSIYDFIKIMEYDINEIKKEILQILRLIFTANYCKVVDYFERNSKDFGKLSLIILLIKLWFSDCLKVKTHLNNVYFSEFVSSYEKYNQNYPNTNFYQIDKILTEAINDLSKNINLTLLYLHTIFEIRQLSK